MCLVRDIFKYDTIIEAACNLIRMVLKINISNCRIILRKTLMEIVCNFCRTF